jgi:hypothetical protein
MAPILHLSLLMVEPGRVDATAGGRATDALWYADADAAASDAIAARNRAWGACLAEAFPGLAPAPRDAAETLDEVVDDRLSAEAMIRRYHRYAVLEGPWNDGILRVALYDGVARLDLPVRCLPRRHQPALAATLEPVVRKVAEVTGFTPWLATGPETPGGAVAWVLDRHGKWLARTARSARRETMFARFGLASATVMGLAAAAIAGFFLAESVRTGTPMATADRTRPATFVTEALLPPTDILGLLLRFALSGRVIGAEGPVRLEVFRDAYLRAGPGARYTVLPTRDPAVPWLLLTTLERQGPAIPLGPVGLAPLPLMAAVISPALWLLMVGLPLWRAGPVRRWRARAGVTRTLLWVAGVGGLLLGAQALRAGYGG